MTGCSAQAPAPTPPTTASPIRYGAPVVMEPRDGRAFAGQPCDLLSGPELLTLGLRAPGRQRTSIDVQECSWRTASDGRLAMAVNAGRDLLVDTYRARVLPIFEPTTVEGMPAVRQRMRLDDNTCTVTTGLGPSEALETEWSGLMTRQTTDPCAKAEEAIALVVRKLPPLR
ncbi:DUF3558 family protein [Actinomycetospora sp. NBRC 106378]|uniref:DUF3558 family protein n=1 Tax=Actinomycetospora sp. NBRC 106378 TaxID=3032208 RepID=UPI002553FFAA|nr:DUF3558 family protein [Actinomycetospora sp. NBRC 106378]